jgi:MFS family permease
MSSKKQSGYLFKYLLLANFLQYFEAGAVPALLLQLANSFDMDSGEQGLLGGVVYLSLSLGGPFAGYLLRNFEHKIVLAVAVSTNLFFTLLWALTPVDKIYSRKMFIAVRFLMGFCQCIICVYLPLWTNENSPRDQRTTWMSYLQVYFILFYFY